MRNTGYIEISKDLLKQKFREYNALYFGGQLGACRFYIPGKNNPDCASYAPQQDGKGNMYSIIRIGKAVRWTEELLKSVLVHEMIHMYVRTVEGKRLDGVLGHGPAFRRHCRRLKRDYGIHIEVHPSYEYINKKLTPKWWETLILAIIDH